MKNNKLRIKFLANSLCFECLKETLGTYNDALPGESSETGLTHKTWKR